MEKKGIRCENPNCQQWYHIGSQNMCSVEHEKELNKGTWICLKCALPNYSTTLFDLHSPPTNSADSLLIQLEMEMTVTFPCSLSVLHWQARPRLNYIINCKQ